MDEQRVWDAHERHADDAGGEPREPSLGPRGDTCGIVTPAGYHRGQNPSTDDGLSEHILKKIADSPDGVVVADEIGLDGITLTSKGDGHALACQLLSDHGFIIAPRDSGLRWYRQAHDIEGGGVVAWDHRGHPNSWMIELPGAQWMRDHERSLAAVFALSLALPIKCTRLDIRRDQFGRRLALIDRISDACDKGQLCRVRDYEHMEKRLAQAPRTMRARGLYLGSRQSERFVRVYDKGLERGWVIPRCWERFESESRSDLADSSWKAIVAAGDAWAHAALDHLMAVVDFRLPCERHARIGERRRPAWWDEFCRRRLGERPSSIRDATDAIRFLRWVSSCVISTLQAVRERLGADRLADVWAMLEDDFAMVRAGGSELAVRGLVESLRAKM